MNLLEQPKILLGSLMIANTLINIAVIILANFLIDQLMPVKNNLWVVQFIVKVVSVAFVLLFFGEVLPKVWAAQNNLQFLYITSSVVEVIYYLFKRVSTWMVGMSDRVERLFGGGHQAYNIDDITNQSDATEGKKYHKGNCKIQQHYCQTIMQTRLDVVGILTSTSNI